MSTTISIHNFQIGNCSMALHIQTSAISLGPRDLRSSSQIPITELAWRPIDGRYIIVSWIPDVHGTMWDASLNEHWQFGSVRGQYGGIGYRSPFITLLAFRSRDNGLAFSDIMLLSYKYPDQSYSSAHRTVTFSMKRYIARVLHKPLVRHAVCYQAAYCDFRFMFGYLIELCYGHM